MQADLEGVGEAGARGFGRLSREMDAANARLAGFSRRVGIAAAAADFVSTMQVSLNGLRAAIEEMK